MALIKHQTAREKFNGKMWDELLTFFKNDEAILADILRELKPDELSAFEDGTLLNLAKTDVKFCLTILKNEQLKPDLTRKMICQLVGELDHTAQKNLIVPLIQKDPSLEKKFKEGILLGYFNQKVGQIPQNVGNILVADDAAFDFAVAMVCLKNNHESWAYYYLMTAMEKGHLGAAEQLGKLIKNRVRKYAHEKLALGNFYSNSFQLQIIGAIKTQIFGMILQLEQVLTKLY